MSMTREEALKRFATEKWSNGQTTVNELLSHMICTIYDDLETQLQAKDEEIKHLKYLLHKGDEHGAEIYLRIGNKYSALKYTEEQINRMILLDQYLKDSFEHLLGILKDNA
ncbi:MAG: hypothetical protein EOL93_00525 [Epsilonproteobacteria bacterium]|nr:hypothetical protein [Campylobacterota bacterium]